MKEVGSADDLYALHPSKFTAARDTLSRTLQGRGEEAEARRVKTLRKPSLSVWAVNQLARREPAAMGRLLEAGEQLRAAQDSVLGGGDAAALRDAVKGRREAVAILVDAAARLLAEAGSGSGGPHLERVRTTLMAAATTPDSWEAMRAGTLAADLSFEGDDMLAFAPVEALEADTRSPVEKRKARRDAERLAREATEAESLARELAEEARSAEQLADRARAAASEARRAALEAKRRAEQAAHDARG